MKITPIEIRQHTFEKAMRGYKPEDVDAFLISLSQEWERVVGDYKMLKMQLEMSEKELSKLKEVEMTLFRTLKTAEDTSVQITEQATKAAEQHLAEARQKADETLADARKRSTLLVQDAENQARFLKDNILQDLKSLEHDFRALEGYKENLAVQIRTLASNAVDSVDRFEKKFAKQDLKGKIDEVATQITDELAQFDAKHKPDYEDSTAPANPPANVAPSEQPTLVERETFAPEALPTDDGVMAKLDEATAESPAPPAPEPVGTEATGPANAPATSNGTAQATDSQPVRTGGSFFDQI